MTLFSLALDSDVYSTDIFLTKVIFFWPSSNSKTSSIQLASCILSKRNSSLNFAGILYKNSGECSRQCLSGALYIDANASLILLGKFIWLFPHPLSVLAALCLLVGFSFSVSELIV